MGCENSLHCRGDPGGFLYLVEDLCRYIRLCIEEVKDVAGVLDAVFGGLLWGGKAVVAGSMEVLEAAGVVL